ncbi:MAG: kelch repeat-containing protein, partial [Minicystis sp.]
RSNHSATLLPSGAVLLTGGLARPLPDGGRDESVELREAELYDPLADRFSVTASLARFRADHSATLLPSGRVLLVGGTDDAGASLEIFDPTTATFLPTEDLPATRGGGHSATLLPSGAVLVAGGSTLVAGVPTTSSDTLIYDDSAGRFTKVGDAEVSRALHAATLLLDGEVLLTGGAVTSESAFFPAAELYAPREGQIRPTAGHMHNLRSGHTATLLASGEVLVTGGTDQSGGADGGTSLGALATAELYQPDDGRFLLVHSMHATRSNHSATLLPSGDVLIAGGSSAASPDLQTAELFDPLPRLFFELPAPMQSPRSAHTATLLRSGEVLLAGGSWGADALRSAEIYDPRTHAFRPTGTMQSAHAGGKIGSFTATLLASGRVLIVGFDAAELFDPEADGGAGAFVPAAIGTDEPAHRNGHSATLLPSGKVLLAGGVDNDGAPLSTSALYDPTSDRFLAPVALGRGRAFHTATLLPSGEVFFSGGFDTDGLIVSALEHWDDALPADRLLPRLTEVPPSPAGEGALIRGSHFLGALETSSGASNGSATNLPLALWLPMTGGLATGTLHDLRDDAAQWTFPASRLTGPGMLFLGAGGRRSEGVPLVLGQDRACRSSADCPAGQACSSAGVCGDPVSSGPPGQGCSCNEAGEPQGPWSGALGLSLLAGLVSLVGLARARCPISRARRR